MGEETTGEELPGSKLESTTMWPLLFFLLIGFWLLALLWRVCGRKRKAGRKAQIQRLQTISALRKYNIAVKPEKIDGHLLEGIIARKVGQPPVGHTSHQGKRDKRPAERQAQHQETNEGRNIAMKQYDGEINARSSSTVCPQRTKNARKKARQKESRRVRRNQDNREKLQKAPSELEDANSLFGLEDEEFPNCHALASSSSQSMSDTSHFQDLSTPRETSSNMETDSLTGEFGTLDTSEEEDPQLAPATDMDEIRCVQKAEDIQGQSLQEVHSELRSVPLHPEDKRSSKPSGDKGPQPFSQKTSSKSTCNADRSPAVIQRKSTTEGAASVAMSHHDNIGPGDQGSLRTSQRPSTSCSPSTMTKESEEIKKDFEFATEVQPPTELTPVSSLDPEDSRSIEMTSRSLDVAPRMPNNPVGTKSSFEDDSTYSPGPEENYQFLPGYIAPGPLEVDRAIPQILIQPEDHPPKGKPTDGRPWWDLMYHPLKCKLEQCGKVCNLFDGATVICPCCGPYSRTRYCCQKHMLMHLQRHWGEEKRVFDRYCVKDSIPPSVHDACPLIINLHNWDTPQRHRQAVWFNTAVKEGDYFIFDDHDAFHSSKQACRLDLAMSHLPDIMVKFNDPEKKDQFRRCLAVCLLASMTNPAIVHYTYRLIRDKLRSLNLFTKTVARLLRYQMFRETNIDLPNEVVGYRHACETEWNGRNPDHCRDPMCVEEREETPLGYFWTRPFFQMACDRLENSHWILRVLRTTHPAVENARDRMRGNGWDDVLPAHQKAFRRGEGWDGAGSGPMEIEGINC